MRYPVTWLLGNLTSLFIYFPVQVSLGAHVLLESRAAVVTRVPDEHGHLEAVSLADEQQPGGGGDGL